MKPNPQLVNLLRQTDAEWMGGLVRALLSLLQRRNQHNGAADVAVAAAVTAFAAAAVSDIAGSYYSPIVLQAVF